MQVAKDRIYGLDVYRVDGAPVAGRATDEHDDHWYIHVKGDSIYAFVPTADGSGYEDIVVDESHDAAQRWNLDNLNTNQDIERFAKSVKNEVDDILIDRAMDQIDRLAEGRLYFHSSNGNAFMADEYGSRHWSRRSIEAEARRTAKEAVDAGSGDEDWTGWKIHVTTKPNGQGYEVASFGFEELGAWVPKPEVDDSEGFLTLGKLIEDGEFDDLDETFANAEAAFADTKATLDRVKEQLAEFKWLNKAKSLPGIIETTMTRDLGENMAPFAKALGEIAGLACQQFPNDDEAVVSYLADGLMNKVGLNRTFTTAVLEGLVNVGDLKADPAEIVASIPTKDEIAAMERKAVESSGISR